MPESRQDRGPWIGRSLLWLAERLVPPVERPRWRNRHAPRLHAWWALVQRGELLFVGPVQVALFCREAIFEALWRRFNREQLRTFLRGPYFLLAAFGVYGFAAGVLSHGFSGTRAVFELAHVRYALMPIDLGDTLVGHIFSLSFGLAIALGVAAYERYSLDWRGWQYWSFFLVKTLLVLASVTLFWIEGGAALAARLPVRDHATATVYVFFWHFSMAAFGVATRWSFIDQRRRCPVCLKRLALPVTMGSWSSVLDPATTEFLCERGHGSLSVIENGSGAPDHWTVFDSSWQGLFETKPA